MDLRFRVKGLGARLALEANQGFGSVAVVELKACQRHNLVLLDLHTRCIHAPTKVRKRALTCMQTRARARSVTRAARREEGRQEVG